MMTTQKTALSQAQQREIYAREGWVKGFNLGKLTAWADVQELAPSPDAIAWRKLFKNHTFGLREVIAKDMKEGGPGKLLMEMTAPYDLSPEKLSNTFGLLDEPLQWFANHLDWGSIRAIPIDSTRLALVNTRPPYDVRVIHKEDDDDVAQVHELADCDVFDVALHSWTFHDDGYEKARRWFFTIARAAIMLLRDQAGVDFDTSVAVSADGKRVLAADYVVIHNRDAKKRLTCRSYQGVSFLLHKIRLGAPHVITLDLPARKKTEEEMLKGLLMPCVIKKHLDAAAAMKRSQVLVKLGRLRVLFIHASDVPDAMKAALATTAPPPVTSSTLPSPGSETTQASPPAQTPMGMPTLPSPAPSMSMPPVLDPNIKPTE
ncbi:MAG: hypothetical protein PHC53_04770 [Patescibacteria group bacterium]|nr:hypothetical protein [Patescibacteria group bacterium]